MIEEQFKKLSETLEAGCQKHIAAGGTITFGAFCNKEEKTCCPIWSSIDQEAVALLPLDNDVDRMHSGLVKALGFKISKLDILSFCAGFDGIANSGGDKMCHNLGNTFREKFIAKEEEVKDGSELE